MNSMKDVTSRITWTRPTQHEYLLDHEGEHVARITLGENDGQAETADGKWSFHRHGFLNPQVLVRDLKTGKQLGRFEATMSGGGMLDLADGRHFRLSANTWKAEWRWLATAGDELVIIDFSGYAVDGSPEGYVEIQEKGRESAHLPMLVTFGCYLIHLIAESEFK